MSTSWLVVAFVVVAFWAVPIAAALALFPAADSRRCRARVPSGHSDWQDFDPQVASETRRAGPNAASTAHMTRQRATERTTEC